MEVAFGLMILQFIVGVLFIAAVFIGLIVLLKKHRKSSARKAIEHAAIMAKAEAWADEQLTYAMRHTHGCSGCSDISIKLVGGPAGTEVKDLVAALHARADSHGLVFIGIHDGDYARFKSAHSH